MERCEVLIEFGVVRSLLENSEVSIELGVVRRMLGEIVRYLIELRAVRSLYGEF